MRSWLAVAIALIVLGWAGQGLAHEGHTHKVMGTVTAIDATHVEVHSADGKHESYALSPETKYVKGATAAALADVQVGARVVLSVVEKSGKETVAEVRMAGSEKPAAEHEH
jgi:hypothetical protein